MRIFFVNQIEFKLPVLNFANMHHIIYHECVNYNGTPSIGAGDSMKNSVYDKTCTSPAFGWAVGGNLARIFPKDTGYPLVFAAILRLIK